MQSTREVARLLGVPPNYLQQMIYNSHLEQPKKVHNRYRWSDDLINRASWKINGRPAVQKPKKQYQIIGGRNEFSQQSA